MFIGRSSTRNQNDELMGTGEIEFALHSSNSDSAAALTTLSVQASVAVPLNSACQP